MTADEVKGALAQRGVPDVQVRKDYNDGMYRITLELEHNGRTQSWSRLCFTDAADKQLDEIAEDFKQWRDEVTL